MVRIIKGLFDSKGNVHILEVRDYTEREHVTRSIYRDSITTIKSITTENRVDYKVLFGFLDFIVDGKKVKTLFYDDVVGYHDGKNSI